MTESRWHFDPLPGFTWQIKRKDMKKYVKTSEDVAKKRSQMVQMAWTEVKKPPKKQTIFIIFIMKIITGILVILTMCCSSGQSRITTPRPLTTTTLKASTQHFLTGKRLENFVKSITMTQCDIIYWTSVIWQQKFREINFLIWIILQVDFTKIFQRSL